MPRMARLVVPNYPHHVVQRGNRRQQVFFSEADHLAYLEYLVDALAASKIEVWAYCLMPNHVHFVVVPEDEQGLRCFFSKAHWRYTRRINFREGWRGHLWQERFHSFVMDEAYLLATERYVELNPVRASLCQRPEDWPWSSVHAHLKGESDRLVTVAPLMELIDDWRAYLLGGNETTDAKIRKHGSNGRPLGNDCFIEKLEALSGRRLRKKKPGPQSGFS